MNNQQRIAALIKNILSFLRDGSLVGFFGALYSKSSLLVNLLIANTFMHPTEFGRLSLFLILANVIAAVVSCGGDMWLNQFTRRSNATNNESSLFSRDYLILSLKISSLITSIAIVCVFIALDYSLALFTAVVLGLNEMGMAIIRSSNRVMKFFIVRDILFPGLLTASLFIIKPLSAAHYFTITIIVNTILFFITILYLIKYRHIYLRKSNLLQKTNVLLYTSGLIVNNFVSRVNGAIDSLLLGHFLPLDLVGKFRLGTQVANGFMILQHYLCLAMPWQLFNPKNKETLPIIKQNHMFLLGLTLLSMIIMFLLNPFLPLVLGSFTETLRVPLFIILLVRFLELLWGPQHELLISNGKIIEDTLAGITGLVAFVLSFLICHLLSITILYSITVGLCLSAHASQIVRRYILTKANLYE
ncbi:MAG: hypothetical protein V4544_00290 [Pseudomonadota bacterium]